LSYSNEAVRVFADASPSNVNTHPNQSKAIGIGIGFVMHSVADSCI
jgi:hypothetical protein